MSNTQAECPKCGSDNVLTEERCGECGYAEVDSYISLEQAFEATTAG